MTFARKRFFSCTLALGLLFVLFFGIGTNGAQAATFRGGGDYLLSEGATVADNLYVGASDITIAGTTHADVLGAAGRITVSGGVDGDLTVAGGSVLVTGAVGGDARIAGGEVKVGGTIKGDLVIAAGTVYILPGTQAMGQTVIFADRVVVDGVLKGDVNIRARTVEMNGYIAGKAEMQVNESISLSDTARIDKGFIYSAPNKALISEHATITGTTTFSKVAHAPRGSLLGVVGAALGMFALLSLIAVALGTVAIVVFFPRFSNRVVRFALKESARSVAVGFLFLFLTPFAILILLLSIVGGMIGFSLLAAYVALLLLGKLLVGALAGAILAQWRTKEVTVHWRWSLLGVVVLFLIGVIPVLGFFVDLLIFFATVGSIIVGMYEFWWKKRKE